jgi:hypothetical protein
MKCTPYINARNQKRYYFPKNEPAPVSEMGHGTPMTSSPPELEHAPTSLLSPVYWTSKIWECSQNASETDGY